MVVTESLSKECSECWGARPLPVHWKGSGSPTPQHLRKESQEWSEQLNSIQGLDQREEWRRWSFVFCLKVMNLVSTLAREYIYSAIGYNHSFVLLKSRIRLINKMIKQCCHRNNWRRHQWDQKLPWREQVVKVDAVRHWAPGQPH